MPSERTVTNILISIGILIIVAAFIYNAAKPVQTAPVKSTAGHYGPPADAPTLDYDEISGLDPQTVKTIEERERNNDLEFRVVHLEDQVRRLNQIVLGIPGIRIGESGEPIIGDMPEESISEEPVTENKE